jgi:RNA polymerase sigma factor (sigma-70 family)
MSINQEPPSPIQFEKSPCNFSEQEQHLNDILNSPRPFELLGKTIQDHIPQKTGYETFAGLHHQAQIDPDNPQPRLELLWLCLPSIQTATQDLRGLGINDTDLLLQGLEIAQGVINQWNPSESKPQQQDYLAFQINTQTDRQLKTMISQQYGLDDRFFPTIKLYVSTVREFEADHHRPLQSNDLPFLRENVSEKINANPNQYPLRLTTADFSRSEVDSRKNIWQGDVIAQIHDIYVQSPLPSLQSATSGVEHQINQNQLTETMAKLIDSLSDIEQKVIRLRFFDEITTLEEVADKLNTPQGAARRLEDQALRKLRHPSKSHQIRDFIY